MHSDRSPEDEDGSGLEGNVVPRVQRLQHIDKTVLPRQLQLTCINPGSWSGHFLPAGRTVITWSCMTYVHTYQADQENCDQDRDLKKTEQVPGQAGASET